MIHVNRWQKLCTAMILPCDSTCLGLQSESSEVSKAKIYADTKNVSPFMKQSEFTRHLSSQNCTAVKILKYGKTYRVGNEEYK